MQPLSYYYYNVLEVLEKPCDVPTAHLQEGYDILYRHGGRIEMDLVRRAEDGDAQGEPYYWYEALDAEQRAKLHKALDDGNPAKILKIMQRNGYAGILYHHAREYFRAEAAAG
ncbi:hypothetical protein GCM10007160_34790 [Litchfieldella qijiaojingensis]|uniref:Uncharacterized protein n=1 Tax=Litchfieldella qijiaojingensis TaxID=980347 RepID=A0ABQ2Z4G9_9GAMM|nr:hypothetical protein [Halomonas qijiaojingensis]GGY04175.1 hypothetical protein GCM10007160_34790 [Halomonas qijiaojingensis]